MRGREETVEEVISKFLEDTLLNEENLEGGGGGERRVLT